MRIEDVEQELLRVANKYKQTAIPSERLEDIICYATHNEIPLAIEMLCDNLFEFDVEISIDDLKLIIDIGNLTGVNEKEWKDLKVI